MLKFLRNHPNRYWTCKEIRIAFGFPITNKSVTNNLYKLRKSNLIESRIRPKKPSEFRSSFEYRIR